MKSRNRDVSPWIGVLTLALMAAGASGGDWHAIFGNDGAKAVAVKVTASQRAFVLADDPDVDEVDNDVVVHRYDRQGQGGEFWRYDGWNRVDRQYGGDLKAACYGDLNGQLYVVDVAGDAVKVIDGESDQLIATVPVGTGPFALCLSPDETRLFCASAGGVSGNTVSVIDCASYTVLSTLNLHDAGGDGLIDLCYNAENEEVFCACATSGNVLVVDGVGSPPSIVDVVADTRLHSPRALCSGAADNVYCADVVGNAVAVISGAGEEHAVEAYVSVGTQPTAVCHNVVADELYAANYGSATVSVIDASNQVVATITVQPGPVAMCYNDANSDIYVASTLAAGGVSRIDHISHTPTPIQGIGPQPVGLCYNPAEKEVCCLELGDQRVAMIAEGNSVTNKVAVGSSPIAIYCNEEENKVYCTNGPAGTLIVLTGNTVDEAVDFEVYEENGQAVGYLAVCTDEEYRVARYVEGQSFPQYVLPFRTQLGGAATAVDMALSVHHEGEVTWTRAIVVGHDELPTLSGLDFTTVWLDAGGVCKTRTFDYGGVEEAAAVSCNANGDIYLTGMSDDDIATLKYDWNTQMQNPDWYIKDSHNGKADRVVDITADRPGFVYVVGTCEDHGSNENTLVLCYEEGAPTHISDRKEFGDNESDEWPVEVSYDLGVYHGVYVAVHRDEDPVEMLTVRYPLNGNKLGTPWTRTVGVGSASDAGPRALATDGANSCYVVGNSTHEGYDDILGVGYLWNGLVRPAWDFSSPQVSVSVTDLAAFAGPSDRFVVAVGSHSASRDQALVVSRDAQGAWQWEERAVLSEKVPPGLSGKSVYTGGWLAFDEQHDVLYAGKGYKTDEWYACHYSPSVDVYSWTSMPAIPAGFNGKYPSKGATGVVDHSGNVYVVIGNNTLSFKKFEAATGQWVAAQDILPGSSGRYKVTGVSSAVCAKDQSGVDWVYLLKGNKCDFMRFNTQTGAWQNLPNAPAGPDNRAKWDRGSWLVYDGTRYIFAHKGKYQEMYAFDTQTQDWVKDAQGLPRRMPGMLLSPSGRKSLDGGCATWDGSAIYALKGTNKNDFYTCVPDAENGGAVWMEYPQMPLGSEGKAVKSGAGIASCWGGFHALRGNKTREFWRFVASPHGDGLAGFPSVSPGGGGLDPGTETAIADGLEASKPRWNLPGSMVTYYKEDTLTAHNQVYQRLYGSSIPEEKVTDMLEDCEEPVYSPNGQYIAFQVDDTVSGFYQLCVTTTNAVQVADDVAVTAIPSPPAMVDSGTTVTPGAILTFHVTQPTAFPAIFSIGAFYSDTENVALPPGEGTVGVSFAPWYAVQTGTHAVKCTLCLQDGNNANNLLEQTVTVNPGSFGGRTAPLASWNARDAGQFAPVAGFGGISAGGNSAPVGAVSPAQPVMTGSTIASRPVWHVTLTPADHCYPEWSQDGNWLTYERDDENRYAQVWRVPAFGGTEEQLTFDNADHFTPKFLNPAEVVFTLSPNMGHDQIARVNVLTHQVTVLSNFPTDHDRPDPSWDGANVVAEALDPPGNSQIVRVPAWGGPELWLTTGQSDIMEPDYSPDNQHAFAVRWTGITSQIVCVDAQMGGYWPVTDTLAIRDNPDVCPPNGLTSCVVYEREAWSPLDLLLGGRKKPGSGIYLSKYKVRKPGDGPEGADLGVYALDRAVPNPATDRVTIHWQLPQEADVSLNVYNTAGQLVKVLASGRTRPGAYSSVWNGTDTRGRRLSNGIYFCTLDNGSKRISRKVVLTE